MKNIEKLAAAIKATYKPLVKKSFSFNPFRRRMNPANDTRSSQYNALAANRNDSPALAAYRKDLSGRINATDTRARSAGWSNQDIASLRGQTDTTPAQYAGWANQPGNGIMPLQQTQQQIGQYQASKPNTPQQYARSAIQTGGRSALPKQPSPVPQYSMAQKPVPKPAQPVQMAAAPRRTGIYEGGKEISRNQLYG